MNWLILDPDGGIILETDDPLSVETFSMIVGTYQKIEEIRFQNELTFHATKIANNLEDGDDLNRED